MKLEGSAPPDVDVAIIGGGMVGATLALLLARVGRVAPGRIVVVEPESVAPPAAAYDLRVSAISPGNRNLLGDLGVWKIVDATRVAAYERMVVWHESVPPDSPDALRFDAAELDEPDLGSIIENRNLQAALLKCCATAGICVRRARLKGLHCDAEAAHVDLDDGHLAAELVVGADGANSVVRRLAGIEEDSRDYGQQGIVATISSERPHQDTAWQRFLSTGPLALLPLADGGSSIVWSATRERATELLALDDEDFARELTAASAGVLGSLEPTSPRVAFPLRRLSAQRFAGTRSALVGDAAHVIHPLAGQGVNEGLKDAAALASALGERPARESVGASRALQRYARERRSGSALMGGMVDALNGLFTASSPAVAELARTGMGVVGRSNVMRRLLFRQAAGHGTTRSARK